MTAFLVIRDDLKGGHTVEIEHRDGARVFPDQGRPIVAEIDMAALLAWHRGRAERLSEIERDADAMAALMDGVSHGFKRIRAFVEPAVSIAEARAMKRQGPEAL